MAALRLLHIGLTVAGVAAAVLLAAVLPLVASTTVNHQHNYYAPVDLLADPACEAAPNAAPYFVYSNFTSKLAPSECVNTTYACGMLETSTCLTSLYTLVTPNCGIATALKLDSAWGYYVTLVSNTRAVNRFPAQTALVGFRAYSDSNGQYYDADYDYDEGQPFNPDTTFTFVNGTPFNDLAPAFWYHASCIQGSPTLNLCDQDPTSLEMVNCTSYSYNFTTWAEWNAYRYSTHGTWIDRLNAHYWLQCQGDLGKPATILVSAAIDRITDVDLIASSFTARYFVAFDWDIQQLILGGNYDLAVASLQTSASGIDIFFSSLVGAVTGGAGFTLLSSGAYNFATLARAYALFEVDGIFSHVYDLHAYPFDTHRLQFTVSHGQGTLVASDFYIKFVPGVFTPHFLTLPNCYYCAAPTFLFNVSGLEAPQGFSVVPGSELTESYGVTFYGAIYAIPYFTFSFVVAREPNAVSQQIVIVILTFCLGLAMFALPVKDSNRTLGTMTAFLTVVAYNFVISASLPDVSYLTRMGRFMNMNDIYLAVLVIYHALMLKVATWAEERKITQALKEGNNTSQLAKLSKDLTGGGVSSSTDAAAAYELGAVSAGSADERRSSVATLRSPAAVALSAEQMSLFMDEETMQRYQRTLEIQQFEAWMHRNASRKCFWARLFWFQTTWYRLVDIGVLVVVVITYTIMAVYFLGSNSYDTTGNTASA